MSSLGFFVFTALLFGQAFAEVQRDEFLLMPKDLVRIASDRGCDQVYDFYDRPAIWEPVFTHGWIGDEQAEIAAFWCKSSKKGAKEAMFRLIVVPLDDKASACSEAVLDWWNYPGGLTIRPLTDFSAEGFRRLSDRESFLLDSKEVGNAIVSEYDGVTSIFYCDDGDWGYRIDH